MNKRTIAVALAGLLVLAIAAVAFAQGFGRGAGWQGPHPAGLASADRIAAWTQALGLTEDQAKKLEALQKETADRAASVHQEMQTLGAEIRTLRQQGASAEELQPKFDQMTGLRQEMWNARDSFREGLTQILTKEQMEKMPASAGRGMQGMCGGSGHSYGHGGELCPGSENCPKAGEGWCHGDEPCPGPQNCPKAGEQQ